MLTSYLCFYYFRYSGLESAHRDHLTSLDLPENGMVK
jgi:hypothetical protein